MYTQKIIVNNIENPFDPINSRTISYLDYEKNRTVSEYINHLIDDAKSSGYEFVVCTSSRRGELSDLSVIPKQGESIFFCVVPEGGDGKDVLRYVALLAVVVVAYVFGQYYAGPALAGKLGVTAKAGIGAIKLGTTMVAATAGTFLVNAVLPPNMPRVDGNFTNSDWNTSKNYGWGPASNNMHEGAILPSLIGERKFAPPIINYYRYVPEDEFEKQYLRVQYALCEDLIDDITKDDIWIENELITAFPEAEFKFTIGDEAEMFSSEWFHSSITEQNFSAVELEDIEEVEVIDHHYFTPTTHTEWRPTTPFQTTNQIDTGVVTVKWHRGLYSYEPYEVVRSGRNSWLYRPKKIKYEDAVFQIRWREIGQLAWNYTSFNVVPPNNFDKEFYQDYSVDGVGNKQIEYQFKIQYGATQPDSSIVTDPTKLTWFRGYGIPENAKEFTTSGTTLTRVGVGLIMPSGLYYLGNKGEFETHSIRVRVDLKVYGTNNWITGKTRTFTNSTSSTLRSLVIFQNLSPNKYVARVYVSGNRPADNRYIDTIYVEYLQEGIDEAYTYRGVATLSLQFLASDKLQNTMPVVNVRARCQDYALDRPSDNPAWAAYYRLVDKHGVPENDIVLSDFEAWAAYCTNKGYTVNLYLDTDLDMYDVLTQIGTAGSAAIIRRGKKWGVIIDDELAPSMSFSMENIEIDSFEEVFIDKAERANTLLAWFFDKENSYRRTPVEVRDTTVNDANEIRRVEVTFYGVTNKDQCVSLATKMLNQTRVTNRTLSWVATIDAIGCQVGDVVYFQHDVPKWGMGTGRVVNSTENTVTIDLPIDFDDPKNESRNFRVFLRHQSPDTGESVDLLETKDIVNPFPNKSVTTYTLSSGTWSKNPEKDSIVSIGWFVETGDSGESVYSIKKVRITKIEREGDLTFRITGVEYYEDAFVDNYVVSIPTPETGLNKISLLNAEKAWFVEGKRQINYISLTWIGNAKEYHILYRYSIDTDWSTWIYVGSTARNNYDIKGLKTGHTYQFAVTADPSNPLGGATTTISYQGVDTAPNHIPPVENLRITGGGKIFAGDSVVLEWDYTAQPGFYLFVIEARKQSDNSLIRTDHSPKRQYEYTYSMNCLDHNGTPSNDLRFVIYAMDEWERLSSGVPIDVTRENVPNVQNLRTLDGDLIWNEMDLEVTWDPHTLSETDFKRYIIEVRHGVTLKRTEYSKEEIFKYSYNMNVTDGGGNPVNEVIIVVKIEDVFGAISSGTAEVFVNEPPSPVSNIQVVGGGTEFTTKDLPIEWTYAPPEDLKCYYLKVLHNDVVVHTETVEQAFYVYAFGVNVSDGGENGPSSIVKFEIQAVDWYGNLSTVSSETMTNPKPPAITTINSRPYMGGAEFWWSPVEIADLSHYQYKIKLNSGTWPTTWERTTSPKVTFTLDAGDPKDSTVYFMVRAVDSFGTPGDDSTPLGIQVDILEVEPATIDEWEDISGVFPKIPVVTGTNIWSTVTDAGGNYVAWLSHELWLDGVKYAIAAGNTQAKVNEKVDPNDPIYILFSVAYHTSNGTYEIETADNYTPAEGSFLIALDKNGTVFSCWNTSLNTVIGSAHIMRAAINDLHVNQVSANKIKSGTFESPGVKIGALEFGDGSKVEDFYGQRLPSDENLTAYITLNDLQDPLIDGQSVTINGGSMANSGQTGTVQGTPALINALSGKGLNFIADGQCLDLQTTIIGLPCSASFWHKRTITDASIWRELLANANNTFHPLIVEQTSKDLGIWEGGHKRFGNFTMAEIEDDTWHHFAVVYKTNKDIVLYVDGQEKGQIDGALLTHGFTGENNNGGIKTVGNWRDGSGRYSGAFSEIRFYHAELTVKEIKALYHRPFGTPPVNVGWQQIEQTPEELTDGRISDGLDNNGFVKRTLKSTLLEAPPTISEPGLYLTKDFYGHHDGSNWRNYINKDGYFHFGNGTGTSFIEWVGGELKIKGSIVQNPGSVEFPVPCWRGIFSSSTTYYKGDVVHWAIDGCSYICITIQVSIISIAPNSSTHWDVYTQKGADGADGADGANGAPGTPGTDGADGDTGPGVVFRGDFSFSDYYYNNPTRRDVVRASNGLFYIYKGSNNSQASEPPNHLWWESFGAHFSSVATDILLAQDAYIDRTLVIGQEVDTVLRGIRSANKPRTGAGDGFIFYTYNNKPFAEIGDVNGEGGFLSYDGEDQRLDIWVDDIIFNANGAMYLYSGNTIDISGGGKIEITSGGQLNLVGSDINVTAGAIKLSAHGSAITLEANTKIDVKASGGIELQKGADIFLYADTTDPAEIVFNGARIFRMGLDSTDDSLYIVPDTANTGKFVVGGEDTTNSRFFSEILMACRNELTLMASDTAYPTAAGLKLKTIGIARSASLDAGNASLEVYNSGPTQLLRANCDYFEPYSVGVSDLGTATRYWDAIHYKTMTAHGCIGWFDDGVELQCGEIVSDIEALRRLKKHPTQKTSYGAPMIDLTTIPKQVFVPAYKKENKKKVLLPRDKNNIPYDVNQKGDHIPAVDGTNLDAMVSIILGAVKELDQRMMKIEQPKIKKEVQ